MCCVISHTHRLLHDVSFLHQQHCVVHVIDYIDESASTAHCQGLQGVYGWTLLEVTSWCVTLFGLNILSSAQRLPFPWSFGNVSLSRFAFIDMLGPRPHQLATCMSQNRAGYELQGAAVVPY